MLSSFSASLRSRTRPSPHGVDQRQELVERGVFPRGRRRGLLQKLERDAAHRMARKLLAG